MPEAEFKTLYLLRHAMALPDHSGSDQSRPLAPQGLNDARALGEYMDQKNFYPDLVICSTAQRTRDTFGEIEQTIPHKKLKFEDILYSGTTGDYLHLLQNTSDSYNSILIIAHNPSIYELIRLLAAQGEERTQMRLMQGYDPATLSVISCKIKCWKDIQPVENELLHICAPIDYNAPSRPTRWM